MVGRSAAPPTERAPRFPQRASSFHPSSQTFHPLKGMTQMKVLASLSILLALLVVSQATAETKSITIGKFTYVGTGTQTRSDGTVIQGVSSYELVFDTGGVTAEPIPFSNAILFVKVSRGGTQSSGFPTITTAHGCGQNHTFPPCNLIVDGGPGSAGFQLAPCAL